MSDALRKALRALSESVLAASGSTSRPVGHPLASFVTSIAQPVSSLVGKLNDLSGPRFVVLELCCDPCSE